MTSLQQDDHILPFYPSLRLFPNRLHLSLHDHQPVPSPARATPAAAAAARAGREEEGEAAEAGRRQPGPPLLQPAARLLLQLRDNGEGGREQRGGGQTVSLLFRIWYDG